MPNPVATASLTMSDRPARRMVILTEGHLDVFSAKTAVGLLRYCPGEVVAVLDSTQVGQDLEKLVGIGAGVPIVGHLEDAMPMRPDTFVIGIAPPGGRLPERWRGLLLQAIHHRLHILSGLHQPLAIDPEFTSAAARAGVNIHDVRHPGRTFPVGTEKAKYTRARRVLTVGTDCNVGKKLAALEITAALRAEGVDAEFLATGQTGIMIAGRGVPLDNVVSDFVSGAAETLVLENGDHEFVLVEGQGGLLNASYGAVTLGLMLGVLPDAMVMVHAPSRTHIRHLGTPIPPLAEVIELHERLLRPIHPSRVVGIALNTFGIEEAAARAICAETELQTGLPTTDCVRFGAAALASALRRHLSR